jgi:hypothetical protein
MAAFDPLLPLGMARIIDAMPSSMKKSLAWLLIILSACSIAFLVWHQAVLMSYSAKDGIETSWLGTVPFFLLVSLLPTGATCAALKGKLGPSILLGILGLLFVGFIALIALAGFGT